MRGIDVHIREIQTPYLALPDDLRLTDPNLGGSASSANVSASYKLRGPMDMDDRRTWKGDHESASLLFPIGAIPIGSKSGVGDRETS